ncbi:MAG: hypothetical protein R3D45_15105 [Rhizobiaceae bacterium]
MRKLITIALLTSFALSGTAIARTAGNGPDAPGGPEGPGASDNNGPEVVRIARRPTRPVRRYLAPKIVDVCGTGADVTSMNGECGQYSR